MCVVQNVERVCSREQSLPRRVFYFGSRAKSEKEEVFLSSHYRWGP